MSRKWFYALLFPILTTCNTQPAGWQRLNLPCFKISVPPDWKYVNPGQQEDSFVGEITGPKLKLSFDCSEMGYANHLLKTEKEYLDSRDWWNDSLTLPFWETTRKVHLPDDLQKIKFPKADYVADLTYKGNTIYLPIEIPEEIKAQHIELDSNSSYVFKTIWPKVAGKGMTGIYIHSRSSNSNFQMNGGDLSLTDQELTLKAFKTIELKNK